MVINQMYFKPLILTKIVRSGKEKHIPEYLSITAPFLGVWGLVSSTCHEEPSIKLLLPTSPTFGNKSSYIRFVRIS